MKNSTAEPVDRTDQHPTRALLRPWWPWLLTGFAYPPAGLLANVLIGRVDSVPSSAVGGLMSGAVLGGGQWLLLRRHGVNLRWVAVTAGGFALGLPAGAALVSYRTDRPSLALMGAVTGLVVGVAQGMTTGRATRSLLWGGTTAALWAIGWTVTVAAGVSVDEQFTTFGASGAFTVAFLQTAIARAIVVTNPKSVRS